MEFQRIMRRREADDPAPVVAAPRRAGLRVGAVDDPAEREADRVADGVMAALADPATAGSPITTGTTRIRRSAGPRASRATVPPPAVGNRIRRAVAAPPVGIEGGPVDAEVERRLAASRGGGRPLAADVRAPMERAFGADFGAVRMHQGAEATALNESLGARAFTLGQDIYVRDGLDVHRSADQRVLAHELAHTVQQGGAATTAARTIRRAVGFEFEVGSWTVEDPKNHLDPQHLDGTVEIPDDWIDPARLSKDTVLYAGTNFNLKPDEAADGTWHLEFVVEPPFQETSKARNKVKSTIKEVRKYGDRLLAAGKQAQLRREGSTLRWIHGDDVGFIPNDVLLLPRSKIEAEPQVTGGVRMDQLAEVLEKMQGAALPGETANETNARGVGAALMGGKKANESLLAAASPGVVRNLFTTFPGKTLHSPDTPSKELVGLLAMIRTYMIQASKGAAYAKSIAPIMARTDFGKMYQHIPEATYYRAYRNEFAELALHVTGFAGQGDRPFFTGGSMYVPPLEWAAVQAALSRQRWLMDIPTGIDRVTEAHFPDRAAAGLMFGLGSLGSRTDTVGKRGSKTETEAPIFEFRRMAGGKDHRVWEPMALELFDYFVAINQRKDATFTATKTDKTSRKLGV